MSYTQLTPDNLAVASLISGGQCRVRAEGAAALKVTAGTYRIRIAVGRRTDSAAALVSVYDSGAPASSCELKLLTASAVISDEGGSITATGLESWESQGSYEYAFVVTLTEPVGEWVLGILTDGQTAPVPMDFSGFNVEDIEQHGEELVDTEDIAPLAVTADKLDPYVLQRRMRYAACSLGGASSTAGAFAQVSWAPSSGNDFELRVVAAAAVAHTSNVRILGRASAGYGSIVITSAGSIVAEENVTPVAAGAASTNGTFQFDGLPHDVRVRFTGTSVTITYDGVVVASTTFPTEAWNNTASLTSIGGQWVTSQARWPGSIHLVELLDLATPANSARFLMDEPPGEAAFLNTYPGTTVGNATKNTGAGYPWSCAVVSHDGRGRVWQALGTSVRVRGFDSRHPPRRSRPRRASSAPRAWRAVRRRDCVARRGRWRG